MKHSITAIYDKGMLTPLVGKLPRKKTKVKITVLEEIENKLEGISIDDLKSLRGNITSYPVNGVRFQRELRGQ